MFQTQIEASCEEADTNIWSDFAKATEETQDW